MQFYAKKWGHVRTYVCMYVCFSNFPVVGKSRKFFIYLSEEEKYRQFLIRPKISHSFFSLPRLREANITNTTDPNGIQYQWQMFIDKSFH